MSYEFYKVLHIFSVLLLFMALGTLAASATSGTGSTRRFAAIGHGVALVLILIAGFGLLAKLRMFGSIPGWVIVKLGIWSLLAVAAVPLGRKPELRPWLWPALPLLGGIAVWMAVAKPF